MIPGLLAYVFYWHAKKVQGIFHLLGVCNYWGEYGHVVPFAIKVDYCMFNFHTMLISIAWRK